MLYVYLFKMELITLIKITAFRHLFHPIILILISDHLVYFGLLGKTFSVYDLPEVPWYVSNALHSYELCSITYDETGSLYEVIFKRMGRGNVEKIKW